MDQYIDPNIIGLALGIISLACVGVKILRGFVRDLKEHHKLKEDANAELSRLANEKRKKTYQEFLRIFTSRIAKRYYPSRGKVVEELISLIEKFDSHVPYEKSASSAAKDAIAFYIEENSSERSYREVRNSLDLIEVESQRYLHCQKVKSESK